MDLTLSDDQSELLAATSGWCRDHLALETARARPPGLWQDLETMGWTGMTARRMGLTHATEALIFCELGRHLAPIALISSAAAERWTTLRGKVALAIADSDECLRVVDSPETRHAIGIFGDRIGSLDLPDDLVAAPSLDQTAMVARLLRPGRVDTLAGWQAHAHIQLLASAFAVGCAETACEMAVSYAKIREQFGRPIGWFQAIKHMCADMALRAAVARSQVYYAACMLDAESRDARFHVAAAKRLADVAALENGACNIQVHGGIGITDEALPHLCLKRAHLLRLVAPVDASMLLQ